MLEGNSGSPWSKPPLKAGSTMKAEEVAQSFFSVQSRKIPRMETALRLLETWPTVELLQNEPCVLMSILNLSHFNLRQLPLILAPFAIQVSDYLLLKPVLPKG